MQFFPCYGEADSELSMAEAEPYKKNEFPQWARDVRRGEIITLGSWPFTTLMTTLCYSFGNFFIHNCDSAYLVNPFVKSDTNFDVEQQTAIIVTSSIVSVGIGVTDLICTLIARNMHKKKQSLTIAENITISPEENKENDENDRLMPMFDGMTKSCLFGEFESAVF